MLYPVATTLSNKASRDYVCGSCLSGSDEDGHNLQLL